MYSRKSYGVLTALCLALPVLLSAQIEVFRSDLITPWGEKVTDQNAWQSYPRPLLQRKQWQNLNGLWEYAVTPVAQQEQPSQWQGRIRVPFCLESKLGGVQKALQKDQALWYRRTFTAAAAERTLLNFEAVDYRCRVLVNGKEAGGHRGGNTPFTLDITGAVRVGENEVVVCVEDEQEGFQLRGKQTLNPRGIWYTQVSGIWQTVWLEQVGASYIRNLVIRTDAVTGTIKVTADVEGSAQALAVRVKDGERQVANNVGRAGQEVVLAVPEAKLWSPQSPHLYGLEVDLLNGDGKVADAVISYAGIRTVGKAKDAQGHLRFTLNGEIIFHWGPLDQGWWPDGLLTPPSEEAMAFEIDWLKRAGFNMIRKHIKVEPRLYYYHCDRLGMMVWQDHVSGGKGAKWTFLKPEPADAEWPDEHHDQFMLELARMISTLESHPSIVSWVPFNEAWGQHRTLEVGKWVVQRDPTRLVNIASGGNFWPVGDIVDAHRYPHPGFPFDQDQGGRFDGFIKVVGEFGGHGYPVKGHLWDADRENWGYGGLPKSEAEYKERVATSIWMLSELRAQGIAGGVYTQTTDVEGEVNGLITYDRKHIKIPAEQMLELSRGLFAK
jgi:beta-galactosidase/beta-glucuronidase